MALALVLEGRMRPFFANIKILCWSKLGQRQEIMIRYIRLLEYVG